MELLPSYPPTLLLPPHVARPEKWGLWGRIVRRYRLLLFRPKRFFAGMAAPRDKNELIFLAFGIGLAAALGRADTRFLANGAAIGGRNWLGFWLGGIGFGAFYAFLSYTLGAFWYRARLRMSRAEEADISLVRRVYLSAAQIVAIPIILKTLIDTFVHDTPLAASLADPTWQNAMYLFFPIWSSIVGFIGARTVFRARPVRAAIWFLVLPGIFYLLMVSAAFRMYSSGVVTRMGPPSDVVHRQEFSSKTMSFSYPGNWSLMKGAPEYDPKKAVSVRPVQDARIRLSFFRPAMGSEQAADVITDTVMDSFGAATRAKSFAEWGGYKGCGRSFEGRMHGKTYSVRVFIAPMAEDLFFYVFEISDKADAGKLQLGFDLIRNSFRVRLE